MNNQEADILNILLSEPFINQRILVETSGHSLGVVNRSIRNLIETGYLSEDIQPTPAAILEAKSKRPRNAVILAAGFGTRMVPINMETPKGLLEVNGEPLIERLIKHLNEVGIYEIYIVVGFMKEQFEYLIDKYGVELIVNPDYALKNNLHSLKLVLDRLSNTYIMPCDIWCRDNPFRRNELYSWYMVSDLVDHTSNVRVNRRMELVTANKSAGGNAMIGICYLLEQDAAYCRGKTAKMCRNSYYDNSFWEEALYNGGRMIVSARKVGSDRVVEINTYEQLRELDGEAHQLRSNAIATIIDVLEVQYEEITGIRALKKGMTNRSFLFSCKGKKYIMRIPGEGTRQLINRAEEAAVYHIIEHYDICDKIIYINPDNGFKITEYMEGARVCDPKNEADVKKCMEKLWDFHQKRLSVDHEFDIWKQINFYESLWKGRPSMYRDYVKTKEEVFSLRGYIDRHIQAKALTHIDAVPDNFLMVEKDGKVEVRLIDWEYAGMQDPHMDLAMFSIYAFYNKQEIDRLIQIYFDGKCLDEIRVKIYCYIAACGLLWSNWCEYKHSLGVEFGEYSLRQYRYAKEYCRIVQEELRREPTYA